MEQELRALQEFEEREREILNENVTEEEPVRPKKRYFRPLPEAEYRSSRVAIEKEVSSAEPKELPKKFMTESTTEAVVRVKIQSYGLGVRLRLATGRGFNSRCQYWGQFHESKVRNKIVGRCPN